MALEPWTFLSASHAAAAGSFLFGTWTQPMDWFLRALAVWELFSVNFGSRSARRNAA